MTKRIGLPKIFFGWGIVITSGLLNLWAGGFQTYGFAALFKPMAAELGFSRAATSVAASIGRFEGGLEAPLIGWISDRFGPKWIILFSVLFSSISFILMNFVNSLWGFYLVWGLMLGTGTNMIYTIALDTAIANWFVKKRGTAMSLKWVLSGLSGVLVVPLVARLTVSQGWRMTCVIGGVVLALVGLPLVWFFVKQRRPEYYGLLPDGATPREKTTEIGQLIEEGARYAAKAQEVEFTFKEVAKTPAYWFMTLAEALRNAPVVAITLHGIPFLTDIGIDPLVAAGILSLMFLVGLPIRFAAGLLADHVDKRYLRFLLGGGYLLNAIGFIIFLLNQTVAMIYVWYIIFGIGLGLWYGLRNPMWARYFGRKSFGSTLGISTALTMPITLVTPIYLGWVYDTTGSYVGAFPLVTALVTFSAVLMFLARPPKPSIAV